MLRIGAANALLVLGRPIFSVMYDPRIISHWRALWLFGKTATKMPAWTVNSKWGDAVAGGVTGFQALPDVLVRSQCQLKLSSTEMMVLINILMHWWKPDEWPHPRPEMIAGRMGVGLRTVNRALATLAERKLVRRLPSEAVGKGPRIRRFDLSGLKKTLEDIAADNRLRY